jgi:FKBP-type peptidyl-prolyl cis-trans isomerase
MGPKMPHFKEEKMNIKNGQTVNIHYVGTLNDGTEFDSSRKKDKPLSFKFGGGQLFL